MNAEALQAYGVVCSFMACSERIVSITCRVIDCVSEIVLLVDSGKKMRHGTFCVSEKSGLLF